MKSHLKLAVFLSVVFAMSTGFTWSAMPSVSLDDSATVAAPGADLLACGGDDKGGDDDDKSSAEHACGDDKGGDDDDKSNGVSA